MFSKNNKEIVSESLQDQLKDMFEKLKELLSIVVPLKDFKELDPNIQEKIASMEVKFNSKFNEILNPVRSAKELSREIKAMLSEISENAVAAYEDWNKYEKKIDHLVENSDSINGHVKELLEKKNNLILPIQKLFEEFAKSSNKNFEEFAKSSSNNLQQHCEMYKKKLNDCENKLAEMRELLSKNLCSEVTQHSLKILESKCEERFCAIEAKQNHIFDILKEIMEKLENSQSINNVNIETCISNQFQKFKEENIKLQREENINVAQDFSLNNLDIYPGIEFEKLFDELVGSVKEPNFDHEANDVNSDGRFELESGNVETMSNSEKLQAVTPNIAEANINCEAVNGTSCNENEIIVSPAGLNESTDCSSNLECMSEKVESRYKVNLASHDKMSLRSEMCEERKMLKVLPHPSTHRCKELASVSQDCNVKNKHAVSAVSDKVEDADNNVTENEFQIPYRLRKRSDKNYRNINKNAKEQKKASKSKKNLSVSILQSEDIDAKTDEGIYSSQSSNSETNSQDKNYATETVNDATLSKNIPTDISQTFIEKESMQILPIKYNALKGINRNKCKVQHTPQILIKNVDKTPNATIPNVDNNNISIIAEISFNSDTNSDGGENKANLRELGKSNISSMSEEQLLPSETNISVSTVPLVNSAKISAIESAKETSVKRKAKSPECQEAIGNNGTKKQKNLQSAPSFDACKKPNKFFKKEATSKEKQMDYSPAASSSRAKNVNNAARGQKLDSATRKTGNGSESLLAESLFEKPLHPQNAGKLTVTPKRLTRSFTKSEQSSQNSIPFIILD